MGPMLAAISSGFLTSSGEEIEQASGLGRSSRGGARERGNGQVSLRHLGHSNELRAGRRDVVYPWQGDIT